MLLSWFSTGDLQFLHRALRLLLSSEHCVANLRLQPEQVVMVTPRFLEERQKMEGDYCRYCSYWFATTDGNLRHESSLDGFKMDRWAE